MASHRRLIAWQEARRSAQAVHEFADRAWRPQRGAVIEQLRRSALSVMLNLAEGSASGRGPRCRYHYRVAHASAIETAELLDFMLSLDEPVEELIPDARRVVGLTFGLLRSYRG